MERDRGRGLLQWHQGRLVFFSFLVISQSQSILSMVFFHRALKFIATIRKQTEAHINHFHKSIRIDINLTVWYNDARLLVAFVRLKIFENVQRVSLVLSCAIIQLYATCCSLPISNECSNGSIFAIGSSTDALQCLLDSRRQEANGTVDHKCKQD